MQIETLRRRADFVRARRGRRIHTPAFLIQRIQRDGQEDAETARIGLTVTKKIGGAVVRNRVKRRLREVVRQVMPDHATAGYDYVFIARPAALTRSFERLLDDLRSALVDPRNLPSGQ